LIISPNKVPARGESTICGFNVEAVPDERRHLRKSVEGELEISRPKGRWRWIVPVVVALMLACVLVLVVLIVLYAVFYSDWGLISSSLGAL
jgi:ABC-type Fe3+ transport system permease subunit